MEIQVYKYKNTDIKLIKNYKNSINYFAMVKEIITDPERIKKTLEVIYLTHQTNPTRKILIICRLIDQAHYIHDTLVESGLDVKFFVTHECKNNPINEKNKVNIIPEAQIIIATMDFYNSFNLGCNLIFDTIIDIGIATYHIKDIAILTRSRPTSNTKLYIQFCDLYPKCFNKNYHILKNKFVISEIDI